VTSQEPASISEKIPGSRFQSRIKLAAIAVTLLGLATRLWKASGTFLNPDEALHYRLANQPSLALAYKESLTAAHPQLLTILIHFWRSLGTSELWLRLPLILASVVFCWVFYKWLTAIAGPLAGFIGLLFVALLPPIVLLSSEIRQYPLLLAFLACALYFLDAAFANKSAGRTVDFSLCLYLALLSHYSAFLFAAALGIYALFRVLTERPPAALIATWAVGQLGALALGAFLYKTHLSKLAAGASGNALRGWQSDDYLSRSYFDPAHDNPLKFLVGHTFGVFQFIFGQLAVGDIMGLLFVVLIVLLLRGKNLPGVRISSRLLAVFLLPPFAIAGAAGLARAYPYGGIRHSAYLIMPVAAGVSIAIVRLAAGRWGRGLAIAAIVLVTCIVAGKERTPRMERADQSRANMTAAIDFVQQNVDPSDLIFTDYQSDLMIGHYLCRQRPISLQTAPPHYEQFSCGGHRVVSTDFNVWTFRAENFAQAWPEFVRVYQLKPGDTVWVFQSGWGVSLPEDLRQYRVEFRDLHFQQFGDNIKIFKLQVGQSMPAISQQTAVQSPGVSVMFRKATCPASLPCR
jgi:Dolichyl-phosphate-mannose-protein mannosyltransferase